MLTDDEVQELLRKLATDRYARWQRGEIHYQPGPDDPVNVADSITDTTWYVGAKHVGPDLAAAGATPNQIEVAFGAFKRSLDIVEPSDLVAMPDDLQQAFAADLAEALAEEPEDGPRRLDEKWAKFVAELRVDIYHNEGQHRGRPHVVVTLQDGQVSVSLENPPEILTPNGLRGEASAKKVVKKYLKKLRKLWDKTRPDDQKLPKR